MGKTSDGQNWITRTWWGPFVALILIHFGSTMVYTGALMLFGGLTSYKEFYEYRPDFTTGMFSYALFAISSVVLTTVAVGSQPVRKLCLAVPAASKVELIAAGIAAWGITNLGGYIVQWIAWSAGEQSNIGNQYDALNSASTRNEYAIGICIFALCAGISEELLCRGLLMRSWLKRWHPGVAIGTSALMFALLHRSPAHVLSVLPVGLWFGYVAWKTRSTLSSILAHVITLVGMLGSGFFYSESSPGLYWTAWIVPTLGGCIAAIWLARKWNKTPTPPEIDVVSVQLDQRPTASVTGTNTDATLDRPV